MTAIRSSIIDLVYRRYQKKIGKQIIWSVLYSYQKKLRLPGNKTRQDIVFKALSIELDVKKWHLPEGCPLSPSSMYIKYPEFKSLAEANKEFLEGYKLYSAKINSGDVSSS
ncbi:MAG: hypothetical protein AB4352_02385 [Hormoscilla sp.]